MFLLGSSPLLPLFTFFSVWGQPEAPCSSMLAFCHTHSTPCITTWSVLGVLGSCPWRLTSWALQVCRTVSITPWLPLCQTQQIFLLETLLGCLAFQAPEHKLIPCWTLSDFSAYLVEVRVEELPKHDMHTRCSTTKQRSENTSPWSARCSFNYIVQYGVYFIPVGEHC